MDAAGVGDADAGLAPGVGPRSEGQMLWQCEHVATGDLVERL